MGTHELFSQIEIDDIATLQAALDAKAPVAAAAAVTHAGGNLSLSLAASVGPVRPISLTGTATTLNAVTNATGGRRLLLELFASGGARTFTVSSPVVNGTDVTFPLSIPSGKVALVGLYYPVGVAYPIVVSARVLP